LVLAGDLGPEAESRGLSWTTTPALVADRSMAEWLKPVADRPGTYRSNGAGRDTSDRVIDLDFVPFYRLHRRTYALYWDRFTDDAWKQRLAEFSAEREKHRKLEEVTVGYVQPGDVANEKAFNQQGEESTREHALGRPARRGKKWFSFDLPVAANQSTALVVTYNSEERSQLSFEVLVEGTRVGEQTIERSPPGSAAGRFFEVEYKIPAELLKDKK